MASPVGWRPMIHRSGRSSPGLPCCPASGNGGPSLWVDGRVVGAWAQTKDGSIHTHYFERLAAARRREIDQRIDDMKTWIGNTRFTVRFPGDIHARLLGTRTVPGRSVRRATS